MKTKLFIIALLLVAAGCSKSQPASTNTNSQSVNDNPTMTITSPAFAAGATIPTKYSCDGDNVNPPLQFADIPLGTKTLALLMDDPDVPVNLKPDGVFDHWVVYNMPATTTEIGENMTPPGLQGKNGSGQAQYTGPCPPDREHRYFFKLYALDAELNFTEPPTKAQVEEAMSGHIVGQAELMARFDRQR